MQFSNDCVNMVTVGAHVARSTHEDYELYLQEVIKNFIKDQQTDKNIAEVVAKEDPFVALPPEVVFVVLSFLGLNELCTLRRVSKNYQSLINSYFRYIHRLDCAPYESVLSPEGLQSVISQVRNLRELNLDFCWVSVTEKNLVVIGNNCPYLRILNTSRCKGVSDAVLEHLSVMCRDLENLNICSCFQITDEGIIAVAENCKKLKELCLSSAYGVTDNSVEMLAKKSHLLEDLDISWCYKVTDRSLQNFIITENRLRLLRLKGLPQVSTAMIASLVHKGVTVNDLF